MWNYGREKQSLSEMQTVIGLAPDQPCVYLNMAYLQLNARQSAAAEQIAAIPHPK
jgi:hypothetical protein